MLSPILRTALAVLAWVVTAAVSARPPNVVVIFADDLGWADIGTQGARGYRTPHLDRLAREGLRLTSFYVSQPVCSASRASLLTGCYANRIGIHGALGPGSRTGISAEETTLAEVLRARGYATAAVGKWHLGDAPQFLPTRHGFDEYFGLPYSNDMWPNHPTAKPGTYPPLPLYDGEQVVEVMPDQHQLTTRYTGRAVDFIDRHRERPFFLYLAHSMPHVPLFVSGRHSGTTRRGLFGDVIREIDWSVGEVLGALRRHGLERDTIVVFTSDNGPWLSYGDHAGSAGPFREGKGTTFEGGVRVPCLVRWPGVVPRGRVSDEPVMTIDLLPTLAAMTGAPLPSRPIDGRDIGPILRGDRGARSPHEALFFYYHQGELQALRSGRWKLHLPHRAAVLRGKPGGREGRPVPYEQADVGLELYDLRRDRGEKRNVAERHPEVVERLLQLAEKARSDMGDSLTGRTGSGTRPPGRRE